MKKLLLLTIMSLTVFLSCEDDASDEFNNNNGNTTIKLIESIAVTSQQDATDNATITVNYNSNDIVTSVTNGEETRVMVYDANGNLTNITGGGGDPLNIEEAYESPYNAFETGEVETYDNNGNPTLITFFEEVYDFNTDTYITVEYTATITYDNKPNPYFHTLDAAGVIDVLDNIELNFSMEVNPTDLVIARTLLPVNNVNGITYRDEQGEVIYNISANHTYDSDNYPTSVVVTSTDDENNVYQYNGVFTYR